MKETLVDGLYVMVNKETWVVKLVKLRLSYKICTYFSRLGHTTVVIKATGAYND